MEGRVRLPLRLIPVAEVTLTQLPLGSRAKLAFRISLRLARCALRKTDSPVPGIPLSRGLSAGGPLMRPGPGLLHEGAEWGSRVAPAAEETQVVGLEQVSASQTRLPAAPSLLASLFLS